MRTIIIYFSAHHGNTEKVAKHLCRELNFDCVSIKEAETIDLDNYDGIIFGSGVYAFSMSKQIIKFLESNSQRLKDKKLGIILTSGVLNNIFMEKAVKVFTNLGLDIDMTFQCLGYDTFGPLRFIGGINKERPNDKDLENALHKFKSF